MDQQEQMQFFYEISIHHYPALAPETTRRRERR